MPGLIELSEPNQSLSGELAAEAITVRIRWFGVAMGFMLVNLLSRPTMNRPLMNWIICLGAVYTLFDTIWSIRGRVFLGRFPLVISLMESVFIGLLCYFDTGLESPFRYYYFLSLLVCGLRHSTGITYLTYLIHCVSYLALFFGLDGKGADPLILLPILGWVTWASSSLFDLLITAGKSLAALNTELARNKEELEQRILERTRQLQESQALLVQHEKQAAFGLLAAGIAHEVGNPLAAISSLVQLLNRRQPDEYTQERLGMVDTQLKRIKAILRELVDFSRPATMQPTLCDIHHVIDEALNIAKYYKRMKGKRIITSYAIGLPPMRIIRDQLVQVLLNLILNAMDATEEGGSIEIGTSLEEGWIKISIRDSGHGIADEHRARVFEPYFTTKATGTGLGLFVCQQIMENSIGGQIQLTDSSPSGTTFVVSVTCENVRMHPNVNNSKPVAV